MILKAFKSFWRRLGILSLMIVGTPSFAFAADELNSGNTAWMIVAFVLVLFMTLPGLALFYGGLVRTKNVLSIFMQCMGITGLVTIIWVLYGYSMAFDTTGMEAGVTGLSAFVGGLSLAGMKSITVDSMSGSIPETVFAMFQLTFAIITPALFIGAFAERMKFSATLVFTALWVTFVYFPICHMVWGGAGSFLGDMGLKDFAGGTVVHINAGIAALVLAYVVGKRKGYGSTPMPAHNITMVFIGTAMLWVGWFGFNAGSQLAADGGAGMALAVTHISAATAAFVWMLIDCLRTGKPSVVGMCTGAVAGLVAITPAAGTIGICGALIMGFTVGVVCYWGCNSLKAKIGYDDSLDAFGVHCIGGIVGVILTGALATSGAGVSQVIIQFKGALITLVYSGVVSFIIAKVLDSTIGLRVSDAQEQEGLDTALHGEKGYNY